MALPHFDGLAAELQNERHPAFVDLLKELNESSDLAWALRTKCFPKYQFNTERTPAKISADTLASPSVQALAPSQNGSAVSSDSQIMTQMAHQFSLRNVRFVGYILKKVLRSLFSAIYVNDAQLHAIRAEFPNSPIILMPNHRTYLDFLLIPFIFFHYEIPLPAIAAATDFLRMKFVASILRNCGAFFIERGCTCPLYRAIFKEYVQTQLKNGDHPMMFFVEGTRSRTGKTLQPKFGMMSALLEPFFRREIYDVVIVPITISYAKVLEQVLYAYELLGYPKPPESTSGLMRARQVLQETNLGDVFIDFSAPISCYDYFRPFLHEVQMLRPYRPIELCVVETPEQQKAVADLCYAVTRIYSQSTVVPLWSIASCVLLQEFDAIMCKDHKESRILFKSLCEKVDHLLSLTRRLQLDVSDDERRLTLPEGVASKRIFMARPSVRDDLLHWIELHAKFIELRSGDSRDDTFVALKSVQSDAVRAPVVANALSADIVNLTVPIVMVASCANPAIESFYKDLSIISICAILAANTKQSIDSMFHEFVWLEMLLCYDFVVIPSNMSDAFGQCLDIVRRLGVQLNPENPVVSPRDPAASSRNLLLFARILKPFLTGYWILCQSLMFMDQGKSVVKLFSEAEIIQNAQVLASGMVRRGQVSPQVLSKDILKNCVASLVKMVVLKKDSSEMPKVMYEIVNVKLLRCIEQIEMHLRGLFTAGLPAVVPKPRL